MSENREEMLVKVSTRDNNNKFYHIKLSENGVITKRWGRVGTEGVIASESTGERGFERLLREKIRKGYKIVPVLPSSSTTKNEELTEVAKSVLSTVKGNPDIDSLIEKLVQINRHEIIESSGGLITVDTSGVISTNLGLIGKTTIKEAQQVLKKLKKAPQDTKLIEEYLSLVPQKVPHQRGWHNILFKDITSIPEQQEFLKQLKESLSWYEAEKAASLKAKNDGPQENLEVKYASLFRSKIDILDNNSEEFQDIKRMYESTRQSQHSSARLNLKRVFVLSDEQGEQKYKEVLSKIGNERRLWHGTRAFNVLSILRAGLFCPPLTGTSYVTTGRMFGDGVYLAPSSSKSLNYSTGYWGGGPRESNCYMFLADVALGQEFKPNYSFDSKKLNRAHHGRALNGKPYNSISIKGGTCGVINDEIIVWNTDAINLKYLCEFGY